MAQITTKCDIGGHSPIPFTEGTEVGFSKNSIRVYIARDQKGNLYLFMHGKKPTKKPDEKGRFFWDGNLLGVINKDAPFFASIQYSDPNPTELEISKKTSSTDAV